MVLAFPIENRINNVVLNEEQQLLSDTISNFLDEHAPTEALRALRDTPNGPAWSDELWQQLCEMGVPSAAQPEAEGGLGFGWMGLGAVLEQMGRRLTVSPLLSSVVFAGSVIRNCGSDAQRERWLARIMDGTLIATVAFQERKHFHSRPLLREAEDGSLSGEKKLVMAASKAELLLVTALRKNGDLGIAALSQNEAGITITEELLFDGNRYATVSLQNVHVSEEQWLVGDNTNEGFTTALNHATLALCAEMMGGARELLDRTVVYLAEREQFGVKIGSFQALQHRCAQAYCQLELAESAVLAALSDADRDLLVTSDQVSRAKAMAGDVYEHISNEAVQLHGGMGVTDEMDIGLFLKRSRVCNQLFGDAHWHRERFATLRGF